MGINTLGDIIMSGSGSLRLPQGTTAQRPTGAAGLMRYNTTESWYEIYNTTFSSWQILQTTIQATGGNITTIVSGGATYKVHTFTSSGTFTVTGGNGTAEVLIVAGGGGGGGGASINGGGGGGAGGLIYNSSVTISSQEYSIVVGGEIGRAHV